LSLIHHHPTIVHFRFCPRTSCDLPSNLVHPRCPLSLPPLPSTRHLLCATFSPSV
jgi:hypothetical protein